MSIYVTPKTIGAFEVEIWQQLLPEPLGLAGAKMGPYLDENHTLDDYEPEWAELIGAEKFLQSGYDGAGEFCAILDTGIDRKSPAIGLNFHTGISTINGAGYLCRRGAFTDDDKNSKTRRDIGDLGEIIRLLVEKTGDFVCSSAANYGREGSPKSYPAAFDETVFAVGSLRLAKSGGRYLLDLSPFSNYNSYVDFVALGEDFWTFLPNSNIEKFRKIFKSEINSGRVNIKRVPYRKKFQWMIEADGTSAASPAFAGIVCALVQEFKAAHQGKLPDMAQLRKILRERSLEFSGSRGKKWLVPTMRRPNIKDAKILMLKG